MSGASGPDMSGWATARTCSLWASRASQDAEESATLRAGTPFVTRAAPAVGSNVGGGIEVAVRQGGVTLQGFFGF